MLCFLSNAESVSARRKHEVTHYALSKCFAWKLMPSFFCCICILLLLRTKFLELVKLIMIDVLHHRHAMIDVLRCQIMIWHANLNLFNVLNRKTRAYFGTPICDISFAQSRKERLTAWRCKRHLQRLPFNHAKVAWQHLSRQKSHPRILVLTLA